MPNQQRQSTEGTPMPVKEKYMLTTRTSLNYIKADFSMIINIILYNSPRTVKWTTGVRFLKLRYNTTTPI